jgi:hypothetical protein
MFNSEIGLFYAPDPAHQGFSRYGYCLGNPISFVDPTGRWGEMGYSIEGISVSGEMFENHYEEFEGSKEELYEQHKEWKHHNSRRGKAEEKRRQFYRRIDQIIQNLTEEQKKLLVGLSAGEATNPYNVKPTSAQYEKYLDQNEYAGIMFSVFNRLASSFHGAESIEDVIYENSQFDATNSPIFDWWVNGAVGFNPDENAAGFNWVSSSYIKRIEFASNTLNGIVNGSINNPVGNCMFFHGPGGNWNSSPHDQYIRNCTAIFLCSSAPTGWECYHYGRTVFYGWKGLR